MAFCKEVDKLEAEEQGSTTITATAPEGGARVLGMVNPPTPEQLWWEICGLSVGIEDLEAAHRRTRRFIYVLVALFIIWRIYA